MFRLQLLSTLFLIAILGYGCGEEQFGFKKNPYNLIIEAHKTISLKGVNDLSGTFSRGALCIWNKTENFTNLKSALPGKVEQLDAEGKLISERHLLSPRFVGFWSYYVDAYQLTVMDKKSRMTILEAKVECDFGLSGTKRDVDKNRAKMAMERKECKIVQIIPVSFVTPSVPAECQMFVDFES